MRIPHASALLGILLSTCFGCSDKDSSSWPSAKNVDTGKIEFSNGPLESLDFCHCSAVIFDFGDSALFAHALPGPTDACPSLVDLTNVVERLIDESHKRNLDIQQCKAVIYTDNWNRRDYLERKLKSKGIQLGTRAYVNTGFFNNVYYHPERDILYIYPSIYPAIGSGKP
jgi:hypothetical protein